MQRSSWCLAIIRACLQWIWHCLRTHDVILFAADMSSALCVAFVTLSTHGSSSSSGLASGISLEAGVAVCVVVAFFVVSSSGSLSGSWVRRQRYRRRSRHAQLRDLYLFASLSV